MKKREFLVKVRRARTTYSVLYLMVFVIAFVLFYLNYQGYNLHPYSVYASIGFIIFCLLYIEYVILSDWWAITEYSFIQSKGIFNKNVREVDFSSISDVDIDQPFFKRLLNHGDVNVRLFLNDTCITVKDVSHPQDFSDFLQNIIRNSKNSKDKRIKD